LLQRGVSNEPCSCPETAMLGRELYLLDSRGRDTASVERSAAATQRGTDGEWRSSAGSAPRVAQDLVSGTKIGASGEGSPSEAKAIAVAMANRRLLRRWLMLPLIAVSVKPKCLIVTVVEHPAFASLYAQELAQEGLPIEVIDIECA
jgi:hypothetical protein